MEMKENLYPTLPRGEVNPSAPAIEMTLLSHANDSGHSYRLKKISEVQAFLENEIQKRGALAKKYIRTARIVDNIDTVLITVTMASGAGGIGLLSTVVAIPAVIALEASALVTGLLSIAGKYFVRTTRSTGEKHQKIKTIADTKLNTISTLISKALLDNHISDEEFKLIMGELEKYKTMKNEVRANTKKKIRLENEESLIERGRQETRESFRRLVEKNHGSFLPL